jgi:uncharacterized damage-inducible protein DinB
VVNFSLDDALPMLRRTPSVLRAWLSELPESWTMTNEGPETWSPFDIVGHLIHGERTDTFAELRNSNLARLQSLRLSEQDFARRGRHPELGPVNLGQLLATWVTHDLNHLGQIARVMGRQYTDAVGPWLEYLPLLHRTRR